MREGLADPTQQVADPLLHDWHGVVEPAEELGDDGHPLGRGSFSQAQLEHILQFKRMVNLRKEKDYFII